MALDGVRVLGRSRPAVLLLPGGAETCDGFFPGLVEGLTDDPGCQAVVHDRPGTGTSLVDGGLDGAAVHLAALVDELGCGPVVVVGQSLGGAVALLLARDQPQAVAGLVLLDPTPINDAVGCARLERTLDVVAALARVRVLDRLLSAALRAAFARQRRRLRLRPDCARAHARIGDLDLTQLARSVRGITGLSAGFASPTCPAYPPSSSPPTADRPTASAARTPGWAKHSARLSSPGRERCTTCTWTTRTRPSPPCGGSWRRSLPAAERPRRERPTPPCGHRSAGVHHHDRTWPPRWPGCECEELAVADVLEFYLVGHGIPDDVVARAFEEASRFFALPLEDKRRVEMLHSPHFRGYTRTGGELTGGRTDWREQIDIGAERARCTDAGAPPYMRLEGPNLWPDAQPVLREVVTDWEARCTAIARRLLQSWAITLGSPADVFDSAFGDRPSTLIKLVRYPGRDDRGQGVGAHKDPGVMTLLMIEPGRAGLQVQTDSGWIDAPAVAGAFVVNIGELLEFATDGYLKATVHRVVSPPPGQTRLSIPFFFNPALDSAVPRIDLPPELAEHAPGVTQDPANVISGTFGENLLKARLRAHPDVAARHHADLTGAQPAR